MVNTRADGVPLNPPLSFKSKPRHPFGNPRFLNPPLNSTPFPHFNARPPRAGLENYPSRRFNETVDGLWDHNDLHSQSQWHHPNPIMFSNPPRGNHYQRLNQSNVADPHFGRKLNKAKRHSHNPKHNVPRNKPDVQLMHL